MKTVKKLKDKHRNGIWVDRDDDVWFYNPGEDEGWRVIQFTGTRDQLGVSEDTSCPNGYFGPYRRIHKV